MRHSFNSTWLCKAAAHPNAARLFINWALTEESGILWSQNLQDNGRRGDVPVIDPQTEVKRGDTFINVQHEEYLEETEKTREIAQEVLNYA